MSQIHFFAEKKFDKTVSLEKLLSIEDFAHNGFI